MVSGSKWCGSSSPIISIIFKVRNADSLFFANLSRFDGTSYSFVSSLRFNSPGIWIPSYANDSIKAKSFAE